MSYETVYFCLLYLLSSWLGGSGISELRASLSPLAGHRRSQDFLWGALFSSKVDDPFLVVVLNTQAKTAKLNTPPPTPRKKLLKNWLLALPGGALTTYHYNLRQKFFLAFEGWTFTQCTPGYAYQRGLGGAPAASEFSEFFCSCRVASGEIWKRHLMRLNRNRKTPEESAYIEFVVSSPSMPKVLGQNYTLMKSTEANVVIDSWSLCRKKCPNHLSFLFFIK